MVVYDITKRPTFDHVARLVEELRAHSDNSIVIILIRKKADLADQGVEFAQEQGLFFSEVSALSKDNVDRAFLTLLNEVYGVVSRKALESTDGRSDGEDSISLKGSWIEVISGWAESEISELKKLPACSC